MGLSMDAGTVNATRRRGARPRPRKALDPLAIERLRRLGGEELVRTVIELFLTHAGPKVAGIRGALDAGDLDAVGRAAHSVRSSALSLGADALCEAAAEIERLAGERRVAELEAELPAMEAAFERVRGRLGEASRERAR